MVLCLIHLFRKLPPDKCSEIRNEPAQITKNFTSSTEQVQDSPRERKHLRVLCVFERSGREKRNAKRFARRVHGAAARLNSTAIFPTRDQVVAHLDHPMNREGVTDEERKAWREAEPKIQTPEQTEAKRRRIALEQPGEQLRALDMLPPQLQARMLDETLDAADYDTTYGAWATGDLAAIDKVAPSKELRPFLVTAANRRWADWIAARSGASTERRPMKQMFFGGTGCVMAGKPSKPSCPVT